MGNERKYCESGMPHVSKATVEVFWRDLERRIVGEGLESAQKWYNEMARDFAEENVNLLRLAENYFEAIRKPEEFEPRDLFNQGVFIIYETLKRQAEANKLEKEVR
jgi:hypothetical protein